MSEFIDEGAKVIKLVDREKPELEMPTKSRINLINAKELMDLDIPDFQWISEGFLGEGLTIYAGRPKSGKSWMALGMSISIARGEPVLDYFKSSKAGVLYFAFEDNYRRLKQRIELILKNKTDKTIPKNLFFQCDDQEVPKLNEGGIVELELLLNEHPDIKFVVIDTLARSRADQGRRDGNIYLGDYEILAELQQLALKKRVCILLIHHTRKLAAENVFDELSGTTGITGAVDTILVLKKIKGENKLFVTGRDISETEYKIKFDEADFKWSIDEEVKDGKKLTAEREEIVKLLKDFKRPMKLSEIEAILDKSKSNLSKLLKKLIEDKIVVSPKYGYFQLVEEKEPEDDEEVLPF